jgi:cell wall-associated NlpC family hydrolase
MQRAKQITFNEQYGAGRFPFGHVLVDIARQITGEHTEFWIGSERGGKPVAHLFDLQHPEHEPVFRVRVRREAYSPEPAAETLAYLEEKNRPVLEFFWPGGVARAYYPLSYQRAEPYTGRVYEVFKADCVTLAGEYLRDAYGLPIPDATTDRAEELAERFGRSFMEPMLVDLGFVHVALPQPGDVIICASPGNPEHVMVMVENGNVLHHPANRLSCIEAYDGVWARRTNMVFRHESKL